MSLPHGAMGYCVVCDCGIWGILLEKIIIKCVNMYSYAIYYMSIFVDNF